MERAEQILCVVDPTSEEQPALQRAAWVAEKTGARLELYVCYYNEYLSGGRLFDSPALEETRGEMIAGYEERLAGLAAPLLDRGLEVTTRAVWDHPLYAGIVRHAAAINADIVFKDTHTHSMVSRALLTNTDWNLIRTCASPLWLVKPLAAAENATLIAALDPMNDHDKPAALDDQILTLGKVLSTALGGELHAFHAYDPRMAIAAATGNANAHAYIPVSLPLDEMEDHMREVHGKRFDEIIEFHEIDKDRAHLVSGMAHEELPALAEKIDATVVIMGAVARNRLKRLFIGSTAERTLDQLACDLLIVKPDWFKSPVE